jgi:hypothetical protein
MTKLTDEQVRALLDGATPGPWRTRPSYMREDEIEVFPSRVKGKARPPFGVWAELAIVQLDYMGEGKGNACLIVAAPDLARALLDARAERDKLQAELIGVLNRETDGYCRHDAKVATLEAEVARLGREVNMARYGQPDFSWSIHKEAMAELQAENARLRDALEDQADFLDQTHHARMTGLGRDPDKYTTELSAQRDKIRAATPTQEPKP